ncbi:MAG: HEAT repeat domain-containing protein [Deltaproteobacteria bacterium]|nr:HEAT repeat domain-containing protein [Deltaproteobacteria bacterium]MCB9785987.1 HEAT repeat domain-containing protein [Deltaproteobacteria bacterium]
MNRAGSPPARRVALVVTLAGLALAAPARSGLPPEMQARAAATVTSAVRSGDFATRAAAVEALGNLPKATALPLLTEALQDQQWQVRRAAIRGLLELRDRSWEPALIAAVASERLDPRTEVLPVLEPLGTKQALSIIKKAMEQKDFPRPDRWVDALVRAGGDWMIEGMQMGMGLKAVGPRDAFMRKLPDLPLPQAVPLYAKVLAKQPVEVQIRVLDRVSKTPEVEDVGFIAPFVNAKDPKLAFEAATVLARRGDPRGKAILVKAASSEDEARRLEAIRAMEAIGSEDLFPTLKPIVEDDQSSVELLRAAYAVYAHAGHPNLARHLEKRLLDTELSKRAAAVRVIGRIKGRAALADLHPLLRDGAVEVRREAAHALADIAMPESIGPVRDALYNEPDMETRLALIGVLGKIRTPEVVPVLQQAIYDPDPSVRLATMEALAAVHHQAAVPMLELLLADRDPEVRRGALLALLDLGPKRQIDQFERALSWIEPQSLRALVAAHGAEVLPHLELAIASDRDELRAAALDALATLPPATRRPVYEKMVRSGRRPEVRVAGIEGLVRDGASGVEDLLIELARDPMKEVRVAAIDALGSKKVARAQPLLFELTDDLDERVRVAAAAALLRL